MITVPLKCKLCNETITPQPVTPIIGATRQPTEKDAGVAAILAHVMEGQRKEGRKGGPHSQALVQVTMECQAIHTAMLLGCFEITPEMQKERDYVFARVHALTRTVEMTDEELGEYATRGIANVGKMVMQGVPPLEASATGFLQTLKDIRDRYESLGKYAPANANAPAAQEAKP